jgi:hypothetical protein
MIRQTERLKAYFRAGTWESSVDDFPLSGWPLVDRVLALAPRFVVDAGCGYHPFRGRIPNCIGVDLVNPAADLVCAFEDAPLREEAFDVALALGSVNFGDVEDVKRDLRRVASWVRRGGTLFFRVNPGEPVGDESIVVFPWTRELVPRLGEAAGLRLASAVEEERIQAPWGAPARRLVWAYEKL